MNEKDARCVIVAVPEREIIGILNWRNAPIGSHLEVTHADIPSDAVCERICHNFQTRCIDFIFSHESFAAVALGCCIPYVDSVCSVIRKESVSDEQEEEKAGARTGQA